MLLGLVWNWWLVWGMLALVFILEIDFEVRYSRPVVKVTTGVLFVIWCFYGVLIVLGVCK